MDTGPIVNIRLIAICVSMLLFKRLKGNGCFGQGVFCKAIWPLVKKALLQAAAIIGAVATVMGVIGFSLADLCGENFNCLGRLILVAVAFAFLTAVAAATSYLRSRDGLNLVIGENEVEVVVGDIFTCDGVRVIPFDEYYDIQVDDKVISRNSLNGIFIERYADWETLQQTIAEVQLSFAGAPGSRRWSYTLPVWYRQGL